jgi:hypothetical protein
MLLPISGNGTLTLTCEALLGDFPLLLESSGTANVRATRQILNQCSSCRVGFFVRRFAGSYCISSPAAPTMSISGSALTSATSRPRSCKHTGRYFESIRPQRSYQPPTRPLTICTLRPAGGPSSKRLGCLRSPTGSAFLSLSTNFVTVTQFM